MSEERPEQQFAFAIFCDDIRHEVGNKLSFIGIYSSDMFVSELPAFVPKLGISIYLCTPIDQAPVSVRILVSKGDDLLIDAELPPVDTPLPVNGIEGHDIPKRQSRSFHGLLPPMAIPGPCMIRAHIVADGVTYVAGKLRIGLQPSS